MTGTLSTRQAATVCHVSERTIRNWIAAGKLPAERTPEGFRVQEEDLAGRVPPSSETRSESSGSGGNGSAVSVDLSELVHLVAKLQEENRVMAGRIGWLEAQLDHARALPAPQVPQDAPGRDSDAAVPIASSAPAAATHRPWWAFWRG